MKYNLMLWVAFIIEAFCIILPHPKNNPDLNVKIGFLAIFFAATALGLAYLENKKK